MPDPNGPSAEDMGLKKEEMKTPEQRAKEAATETGEENERAERLENLRRLAEPMLDQYYQESKTPFGIPRDQAMKHVSERIFDKAEAAELNVDYDFLQRANEVMQVINEASGHHYTLTRAALEVIEHHLQTAASGESNIDLVDVAYIAGEMGRHFKKATGATLAEWAVEYQKVHGDQARDMDTNVQLMKIFDQDIGSHVLSQSNLRTIFRGYAGRAGIDQLTPDAALKMLQERRFLVPEEWKDEFAENEDGREILEAIENVRREIQIEEIITTLEGNYEGLSPEDRKSRPITVGDVLAVASFEGGAPENWADCDDNIKKIITAALKELAENLDGKVGKNKGEPIVKFS